MLISHTSIALPFALGVGAAWWLRDTHAPKNVAFLPFALFMGTAMSVTAFPVLARILSERGLMQSRVGAIAIACAAVDDVTAWCLLAVVVAISAGVARDVERLMGKPEGAITVIHNPVDIPRARKMAAEGLFQGGYRDVLTPDERLDELFAFSVSREYEELRARTQQEPD